MFTKMINFQKSTLLNVIVARLGLGIVVSRKCSVKIELVTFIFVLELFASFYGGNAMNLYHEDHDEIIQSGTKLGNTLSKPNDYLLLSEAHQEVKYAISS